VKEEKKKGWIELEAMKGELAGGAAAGDVAVVAGVAGACTCEAKFTRMFEETQERLEKEGILEKEQALQELEERVSLGSV